MNARALMVPAFAAAAATFAAGASAAYLSEDLYGTARLPAAAHRSTDAVPQSFVGLKADGAVPQDL